MSQQSSRAESLSTAAARLASDAERVAFLERECAGDAALRETVEALLRSRDGSGSGLHDARTVIEPSDATMLLPETGNAVAPVSPQPAPQFKTTPGPARDVAKKSPVTLPPENYAVGGEIARGGMGSIIEAEDRRLGRKVAMKVMRLEADATEGQRQRFIREATVLARLEHPNVVPIHELGRDAENRLFYTMKLVQGRTLQAILNGLKARDADFTRHYTLDRLLTIFRKICDALSMAHSKGIIHRDLKPENVMVGEFGEVLVMDWGIAKLLGDADGARSGGLQPPTETNPRSGHHPAATSAADAEETSTAVANRRSLDGAAADGATLDGTVMGTPHYMSPEQADGRVSDIDQQSDVFSLGAILYALLTLHPPVEASSIREVLERIRRGDIRPPTEYNAPTITGENVECGDSSPLLDGGGAGGGAHAPRGAKAPIHRRTPKAAADPKQFQPLAHCPAGKVPAALSAVAMKALTVDKARRYPTVQAFAADIEKYQSGFATSAEQAGAWRHLTLLIRRNKAASIGVAAVLLVGGVLGTKAIIEGRRAERGEALAKNESAHAKLEAARAERGEAAAKATLADLRRTAPIFFAQAKIVLEEGDLDDALEKIGYAIQLDDANADYHLFRAHLRQSAQDLAPAAEGYRRVLALRPADASAKLNLALCEKLLRESGGAALQLEQQRQLLAALRTQKRLVESAPLAALIDPSTATAKAALLAHLREYQKQPGWNGSNMRRVTALPDGTFKVSLYGLAIGDLSVLQGQPVSELDLENTNITDLSSLTGLPLKDLKLADTKVSDLSPLRGMPLESLHLGFTLVTDLSPLRGMKLRKLNLKNTGVSDLSPLAGMPLTDLDCTDAKSIADLAPLKGAPLVSFQIRGASRVSSIAPLAGAPLKVLFIVELPVSDLSPLAQCPELEELILLKVPVTDLTPLARLPITRLNCDDLPKLADLGPLRGMPLRFLGLSRTQVTDLRPLADCPTLEELILPAGPLDLTPLRHLPKLRRLSTRGVGKSMTPTQTAEEFWKEYDAQPKPAGK